MIQVKELSSKKVGLGLGNDAIEDVIARRAGIGEARRLEAESSGES